ncbi:MULTISPECIES: hypothetical protein [unclassified Pseudomonas]|uniref:hypothetical protein n=1 Tax=unclassified Pseudomonas TaxID=196821 RepID=UPI00249B2544|nr:MULTISPECIES: hypothetical protein [unclassified Pseudomonas]
MKENSPNHDFDEDASQDPVSAIIGNDGIEKSLSILVNRLDDYMEDEFGERTAQEEIDDYLQDILSGQITKKTILNYNTERLLSKDLSIKKESSVILSFIYTAIAQHLIKHEPQNNAWAALLEAKHYLAYHAGLTDPINHKKTERAQKGGRKKAQNALDLEKLAIEILINNKPKKGWLISYDAAKSIASELSAKAKENNIPIPSDMQDLIHKLIILIDENEEVSKAFNSPKA